METTEPNAGPCPGCGTVVPTVLRNCPGCGAILKGAELTRLAGAAEEATRQGELSAAIELWKQALDLLPDGAPQRVDIEARLTALNDRLIAGEPSSRKESPRGPGVRESWRSGGFLAAIGALLLKFKTLILLVLTKAKLVLFGLAKAKTLFSMLLFFGVYWARWGWKFALGFVVSIFLHEMGHVVAARRFGIRASAPMFIPFLGAFIMLKERVTDPRVNARIGLAGPVWGLGTALAFYVAALLTGLPVLAAIAELGAWVNLFNLLPVWSLDGARGFASLTKTDRWCVVGVLAVLSLAFHAVPLLVLLTVVAGAVTLFGAPAERSDRPMLALFVFLTVALAALGATALELARGAVGTTGGGSF